MHLESRDTPYKFLMQIKNNPSESVYLYALLLHRVAIYFHSVSLQKIFIKFRGCKT